MQTRSQFLSKMSPLGDPSAQRKVFTEWFPAFVELWARMRAKAPGACGGLLSVKPLPAPVSTPPTAQCQRRTAAGVNADTVQVSTSASLACQSKCHLSATKPFTTGGRRDLEGVLFRHVSPQDLPVPGVVWCACVLLSDRLLSLGKRVHPWSGAG